MMLLFSTGCHRSRINDKTPYPSILRHSKPRLKGSCVSWIKRLRIPNPSHHHPPFILALFTADDISSNDRAFGSTTQLNPPSSPSTLALTVKIISVCTLMQITTAQRESHTSLDPT